MPRYIDPRKIDFKTHAIPGADGEIYLAYSDVRKAIAQTPSEDVVEVVRCKDCRHSTINGGDCNSIIVHYVRNEITELNEEAYSRLDYCSYGKRKEQT